jgi:CheY-like chemotaxis protein
VNQELALEVLQEAGIRVDVAQHGAQALEMLRLHRYDGVLMDCQMPVMDGFEATRIIRRNPEWTQLPILAMTANAMTGDRELCLEAGMNDHIGKPIDVNQLFATLARWITPSGQGPQPAEASTTAPDMHTLPDIAGLDLAQALRRMGGNAPLVRKLLGRFLHTQADTAQRMHAALDSDNWESATREAHTLKGLAGNIGANTLAEHAGALEAALRQKDPVQVQHSLPLLEQMLQQHLAAIAQAVPQQTPAASGGVSPAELADLPTDLQDLATLLADDDARAAKQIERIAAKLAAAGQAPLALQLQKQIARYAFDDGLETLRQLAHAMNIHLAA